MRMPGFASRVQSSLFLRGEYGQSAPILKLKLGAGHTGNIWQIDSANATTAGDIMSVAANGTTKIYGDWLYIYPPSSNVGNGLILGYFASGGNTVAIYNATNGAPSAFNGSVIIGSSGGVTLLPGTTAAAGLAIGTTTAVFIDNASGSSTVASHVLFAIRAKSTQTGNLTEWRASDNTTLLAKFNSAGALGLQMGATALTAFLHLGAGLSAASGAPIKLTSGTNLATPETGAIEYNGTNLFFTRSGTTRETNWCGNDGASAPSTNTVGVIVDYYGSSATRVLTTPNSWASVNIGGTTYKVPLYT